MADPLKPRLQEHIRRALPTLLAFGLLFAVLLGWLALPLLSKIVGEKTRTAETHTVTGISANLAGRIARPMVHTRDPQGNQFVFGLSSKAIGECKIGQSIVVWRIGASATLDDEECKKEVITDDP